jgi:hypothetical protein
MSNLIPRRASAEQTYLGHMRGSLQQLGRDNVAAHVRHLVLCVVSQLLKPHEAFRQRPAILDRLVVRALDLLNAPLCEKATWTGTLPPAPFMGWGLPQDRAHPSGAAAGSPRR